MTGRAGLSFLWATGSWHACKVCKGAFIFLLLAAARLTWQTALHCILFMKTIAKRVLLKLLTAELSCSVQAEMAARLVSSSTSKRVV